MTTMSETCLALGRYGAATWLEKALGCVILADEFEPLVSMPSHQSWPATIFRFDSRLVDKMAHNGKLFLILGLLVQFDSLL